MKQQIWHIRQSGIKKNSHIANLFEFNSNQTYWLEINSDDRNIVADFLRKHNIEEKILERIVNPGISPRFNVLANSIIFDLPIPANQIDSNTEYLTVLISKNMLVTVLNNENNILKDIDKTIENNSIKLQLNVFMILYFMISEIIQFGIDSVTDFRNKINSLSKRIDTHDDIPSIKEIINTKHEMGVLSGIIEDQYNIIGFVPRLNWDQLEEVVNFRNELKDLFRGFEHVQKNLERLEDKLESIQSQYQLILQEKGNKKLNTLTIIQAIFVPLTLIAGIYGMNFTFMPELTWSFGYFLILGLMGLLILGELLIFKRKGWFD